MIIAAYNMLTNGDFYRDPGADYYTDTSPPRPKPARSTNSKHSDTESPCNHSRNRITPPPSPITRCGHPYFRVSAPVSGMARLARVSC